MYAKIDQETGQLIPAPPALKIEMTFPPEEEGGEEIVSLQNVGNPTPGQYAEAGYLPVVESQRPEDGDGYYYVDGYEPDGDHIAQVWERREYPAPEPNPEISAERALGIILTGRDSDET